MDTTIRGTRIGAWLPRIGPLRSTLCVGIWLLGAASPALAQAKATQDISPQDAGAQESPASNSGELTDIVVTAQRRSQRLQEVPIAVTAISASEARARGLTDVLSLAGAVPNLNLISNGPNALNAFIRGVGTVSGAINSEPSVATYVDGVYIASSSAAFAQSFSNVAQIEVLKGPQGTLFGRNSTGGVIQITTLDPLQAPHLNASVEYGNYDTVRANAYMTAGWSPAASTDIAAYYDYQGNGYGVNFVTGSQNFSHRNYGFRSKTLITPTDTTEIRFTADYTNAAGNTNFQLAPGVTGVDGSTYPGPYNARNDLDMFNSNEQYGFALRIDQDLDFARLVSISSYRRNNVVIAFDTDSTPLAIVPVNANEFQHNVSQELQLLSSKSSRIDWLVGAYYFDSDAGSSPFRLSGAGAAPFAFIDIDSRQRTVSKSLYAQATAPVIGRLKATVGIRYTWERISLDGTVSAPIGVLAAPPKDTARVGKPSWRLALDYPFSRDVHGYVSWNRGLKSGGFNLVALGTPAFAPEKLDAYEAGLKSELFDRRVRLNVAAFYYDYRNIQVQLVQLGSVVFVNAGAARMYGLDADLTLAATERLSISAGLGLLDARYTDYPNAATNGMQPNQPVVIPNARGARTPLAAPVSASATVTYKVPLGIDGIVASGTVIHNARSWADPANRLAYPAYTLANASIGWHSIDDSLLFELWGRNLTNARYFSNRFASGAGDLQLQAPPRTYGVRMSTKF